MPDRPAISADVQRQVFIESGHRCAVCGTPFPLERAHIIPWCRSGDHSAENLICLCANCHERADREWDEKTLREYKANPWVMRQNCATSTISEVTSVEIEIDLEVERFDDKQSRWLRHALAGFLDVHPEAIRIRSVRKGSVKVNIEVPSESADLLINAVSRNDPLLSQHVNPLRILNARSLRRNRVLLSHGRDERTVRETEAFLKQLGLRPILFHADAAQGRTTFEGIESLVNDVDFAVVIATSDDRGGSASDERQSPRARQNVIFELGFLMGKLGRERVCLLRDESIELPSDIEGLVTSQIGKPEAKRTLVRCFRQAALDLDVALPIDWEE